MSAFMIATGAAAMDLQVTMFFAFWSLVALKKTTRLAQKTLPQKMLSTMLPSGPNRVGTSKMNGAIVREAMWLVTRWGIARRLRLATPAAS